MKKVVQFVFLILLGIIIASNATLVFASSGYVNTYLFLNQVWDQSVLDASRTGNYSNVYIKVYTVYPPSGPDNYTKCKFLLYHPTIPDVTISAVSTYTEGSSYYKSIYEGYLSLSTFDICVSGNNPSLDGYVYYWYNGR